MNPCKITGDLLPLYIDGTLSEDSQEYVNQHLAECEECRQLHSSMKKSVEIVLSRKNAQSSFKAFKRRLFWKKFLLTMLCAIAVLALMTVVLYRPIDAFLNRPFLMRIEPVEEELFYNNGRVEVFIDYTVEDQCVSWFDCYTVPSDPETVYISPYYTRMGQINEWWSTSINGIYADSGTWWSDFAVDLPPDSLDFSSLPNLCKKIILKGSDGERVIWEKGDALPVWEPPAQGNGNVSPQVTPWPGSFGTTARPADTSYHPAVTATP